MLSAMWRVASPLLAAACVVGFGVLALAHFQVACGLGGLETTRGVYHLKWGSMYCAGMVACAETALWFAPEYRTALLSFWGSACLLVLSASSL